MYIFLINPGGVDFWWYRGGKLKILSSEGNFFFYTVTHSWTFFSVLYRKLAIFSPNHIFYHILSHFESLTLIVIFNLQSFSYFCLFDPLTKDQGVYISSQIHIFAPPPFFIFFFAKVTIKTSGFFYWVDLLRPLNDKFLFFGPWGGGGSKNIPSWVCLGRIFYTVDLLFFQPIVIIGYK